MGFSPLSSASYPYGILNRKARVIPPDPIPLSSKQLSIEGEIISKVREGISFAVVDRGINREKTNEIENKE